MNSIPFTRPVDAAQESYRDSISTVDKTGHRVWIYPKKPKGKLTNYRTLVSVIFLTILFSLPFIKLHDEPFVLFDFFNRKFIVFGILFRPQDFGLLALGFIASVISIVLFTVVYGRIFCGWVCPQTIFMEGVFRKIEYWIEGDWKDQMALDKQKLTATKFAKKFVKHVLIFTISFIIANTFLAYIIGVDALKAILTDSPMNHLVGLGFITLFTGVFYWIYAKFREQVCTTVCPYGRLQGVMLDRNSIVVAYDYVRGEKREKIKKGEDRKAAGKGDCIDCHACVHVCPTGIDIRNGTQLECINCTACIDACNDIMEKIGQKKGLIRYASEAEIAENKKFKITLRMLSYSLVLVVLMGAFGFMLATRPDVEGTLLRTPGILYQKSDDGKITNIYNVKVINNTNKSFPVTLKVLSGNAEIKMVGKGLQLDKQGTTEGILFIAMDRKDIRTLKTKLAIGIYAEGKLMETIKTTFIGPVN